VGILMVPVILFYTVFVYRKLWGRDRRLSAELVETESKVLY
jgi:cytochrome bd-type quinol oxidase subunit 2